MKNTVTGLIAAAAAGVLIISCTPKQGIPAVKARTAAELAKGKTVYDNSCGKCHDLPAPTDHSAQEWVGIMNAMAPKANLTDTQHQLVYDYIVSEIK